MKVGVTTEMMQDFAEERQINLCAFHGNKKVAHVECEGSSTWLTFFNWDNHAYFVKNSRYYIERPLSSGVVLQKVDMEKDERPRSTKEWEMWTGEIKTGIFTRTM